MNPILLSLGSIDVRAYGVAWVFGYLLGGAYLWAKREDAGLSKGGVVDFMLAVAVGGLIGGKLGALLFYYGGPWDGLGTLTRGGFSFYQGQWGAMLAAFLYCRATGASLGRVGDRAAVAIPLGHAVGRLGCFLNGCCYGEPTSLPWGVCFDAGGKVPRAWLGLSLHPTQLFDLAGNLLLAVLLHRALEGRSRKLPPGSFFCAYLAGYGLLRFLIEPLRGDAPGRLAAALTTAQWVALAHIVAAAWLAHRIRLSGPSGSAG